MNRSDSFLRRWAIPLAALFPLFAIVFAFSLGPSPRKTAADYFRAEGTAEARLARLDRAGPAIVGALAERIHERGLPHRAEAIAYLGRAGNGAALPALERVLNNEREQAEIRNQAFESALAIDRRRGLALAEELSRRTDALGAVARRALERQERSSVQ